MHQPLDRVPAIRDLKQQKNATILAHLYQRAEIQDLADHVGDSLELSRLAQAAVTDMIVFCGVRFMAETAKILNPDKKVLLPEPDAGCPMADQTSAAQVIELRRRHPGAAVVCYVNSSAEVKAVSDLCCTSANAVRVVSSLAADTIIFVPDRNLGHYVSRFLPEKQFILIDGCCPVHDRITAQQVARARQDHPHAAVYVHPECPPEVIDMADFTGSTSQMIERAAAGADREIVIGTEQGILHALQRRCPGVRFYQLTPDCLCPDMQLTTLESLYQALLHEQHAITLDPVVSDRASASLRAMLAL